MSVLLYIKFYDVLIVIKKFTLKASVFSFGLPIVIVAICIGVPPSGITKYQTKIKNSGLGEEKM